MAMTSLDEFISSVLILWHHHHICVLSAGTSLRITLSVMFFSLLLTNLCHPQCVKDIITICPRMPGGPVLPCGPGEPSGPGEPCGPEVPGDPYKDIPIVSHIH